MTERLKRQLEIGGILIAIGIAWATLVANVSNKVDYADFKADSIEVRSEIRGLIQAMGAQTEALKETNVRLKELACDGRPGCR